MQAALSFALFLILIRNTLTMTYSIFIPILHPDYSSAITEPPNENMNHQRRPRRRSAFEATRRYLRIYETSYVIKDESQRADMCRLRNKCEAYIHFLRKVAPNFYKDKLADLIDQVGSLLLSYDISTEIGQAKIHETHAFFLVILQELRKSQPAEHFDFFTEKKRFDERTKHEKRYESLMKQIGELESTEFELSDLEKDGVEDKYTKVTYELARLRAELRCTALEIAYLDGEELEEEVEFKLTIRNRHALLNRLTEEQRAILEFELADLYRKNRRRRDAQVDKTLIDEMIERLNIDMGQFRKCDIHDMAVEALQAYNEFRRKQDQERNEEYFKHLLENEQLKPKEGLILQGPDDITPEVRMRLEQNGNTSEQAMEVIVREYRGRDEREENLAGDQISDTEDIDDTDKIIETIKNKAKNYARVKEEPFDPTELEQELLSMDFDQIEQSNQPVISQKAVVNAAAVSHGATNFVSKEVGENRNNLGAQPADSDDDIECLGLVESRDKIKTIDIE